MLSFRIMQMLRALACGLAFLCFSTAHAAPAEPFKWDPKVVRGTLDNGFEYYLVPSPKASHQVGLHLIVRAGSVDERDDQSGVAHMVEHMVFHATRGHPEGLHAFFKKNGLTIGRHYNAQTNFERTLYMLGLDPRTQSLQMGLEALGEIAGGALMPEESLEKERSVILEEWRMKLGVRERMESQRRALLRSGSLAPERPTIGTEASIRGQSAQALRAFYADWYRPGNMALIVVGDMDLKTIEPMIRARFGGLKAAALPPRNALDPVLGETLRIGRMQDAESGSSQVGWVSRFGGDNRQDSEGLRHRLLDRLAERMVRHTVRQQAMGLPASVESLSSRKGDLGPTVESLGVAASVSLQGHQDGLKQILLAKERLLRGPIDTAVLKGELDEIRRLNAGGVKVRDRRDQATWLQLVNEVVTTGRVLQDPVQKQAQIDAILPSLTAEAVHERIRRWLSSPDRLVFMIAPGLSPLTLPTQAEVLALEQQIADAPLPPLPSSRTESVAAVNMPVLDTSGAITAQVPDAAKDVTRWQLANGDQFIWLRTQDKTLHFAARSGAGYRLPGAQAWEWQMAEQLARDSDLKGQAAGALSQWQKARQISLSQSQTATQLRQDARVKASDLDDLFRLSAARQVMTSIPADGVRRAARQLQRQDAKRPDSVNAQLAAAMSTLRFGDQAMDRAPQKADLQALEGEEGAQRIQTRWQQLAAQPVSYFLMGDVDPAILKALVQRHLAGIARQAAASSAQPLLQEPGSRERILAIGIEPQASVRAQGSQAMDWTPERAIGAAVLSRVIHRALRTELRDKESGVYRLSFELTLDPHTNRLNSELHYTADPARIKDLWARTRQVLAALPNHLDPQVLQQELRRMQQQEQARQGDPDTRFQRLQLSLQVWGDARYIEQSKALGSALTADKLEPLIKALDLNRDQCSVLLLPRSGV